MSVKKDSGPQPDRAPDPASRLARIREFLKQNIWVLDGEKDLVVRGPTLLRVLALSSHGLLENRLFSRAAALSFSSLIALGPLIAIIVLFTSSLVETDAETQIKRVLLFIAPSLQEMAIIETQQTPDSDFIHALDSLIDQIVEGAEGIIGQVNTSGSKAFGTLGAMILIWVVIQLLTSVETTLNQIWGVHQGRPWVQRIVFYWTFVTLGALLGLGSGALFSASNLAGMSSWVPYGSDLLLALSPLLSFSMLILLLTFFYRFFPNTSVTFKAALIGSLLTGSLLFLNNYLSILYVQRVLSFQSLYGSVGIIPVLMIGLYFFWVLILLGGQLTYAVQNVDFLTNQSVWKRASPRAREFVTVATFFYISRKFLNCEPAPSLLEISRAFRIPVNIINEALNVLEDMNWINHSPLNPDREESNESGYRPTRPLQSYTLSAFKEAFEQLGNSVFMDHLVESESQLDAYQEALKWHEADPLFQEDLHSLLSKRDA